MNKYPFLKHAFQTFNFPKNHCRHYILLLMVLPIFSLYAQTVSIHKKKITTEKLLKKIQKETGYSLWYPTNLLRDDTKISVDLENVDLKEAMQVITANQPFTYEIIGKGIVLKKRNPADLATANTLENNSDEEQTVNTGYGYVNKKVSTSSISRVGKDELSKNSSVSLEDRLSGRIPGLTIENDGSGNLKFRIRGQNSFQAGNDPLILVDGLPFTGSLSILDPNTIQDVNVLKGADATALYGSRGANGVIVITTTRSGVAGGSGNTTIRKRSNGMVSFDQTTAAEVLEEIATWHNMKINYTEPMEVVYYSGELDTLMPKDDLFNILKAGGINIRVDNANIVVMPDQ